MGVMKRLHARVGEAGIRLSRALFAEIPMPISRLFLLASVNPLPGPGCCRAYTQGWVVLVEGGGVRERGTHLLLQPDSLPGCGSSPSPAKEQRGGAAAAVATRSAPGPPALELPRWTRSASGLHREKGKKKKRTGKQRGKRPGQARPGPARWCSRRPEGKAARLQGTED